MGHEPKVPNDYYIGFVLVLLISVKESLHVLLFKRPLGIIGDRIIGPPETPSTPRSTEVVLKGPLNSSPIMPRGGSMSDGI